MGTYGGGSSPSAFPGLLSVGTGLGAHVAGGPFAPTGPYQEELEGILEDPVTESVAFDDLGDFAGLAAPSHQSPLISLSEVDT
jgi:hypothetical protein